MDIKDKKKLSSLSDFVKAGRKDYLILELVLISANIIQAGFCYYLFSTAHLPNSMLLGTLAGLTGVIATLARIDKHKIAHISLTIVTCSLFTLSILITSFTLNQPWLIAISIAQVILFIVGYFLKIQTKHLEVVYFYFLGLWNVLMFIFFLR